MSSSSRIFATFISGLLAGIAGSIFVAVVIRGGTSSTSSAFLQQICFSSEPPCRAEDDSQGNDGDEDDKKDPLSQKHANDVIRLSEGEKTRVVDTADSIATRDPEGGEDPVRQSTAPADSTEPQQQPEGEVPDDANEDCPGLESDKAGKSEACAGCPNQTICASGEATKEDPAVAEVRQKLLSVKHKLLVLSGKGGVGKSTVSSQLAWTLQQRGFDVGLLDIDICGPSIAKMTGCDGQGVHPSGDGWSPVYVADNFGVMSVAFLLPSADDAVIWRGPKKNGLIRQFLTDVTWGNLDFLIIDTPPGTSDEHLSIVTYLKKAGIDGAVVVTTPQEIALADVRKEINFCKKTDINVIGVVENMTGSVFQPTTGGATTMCENMNVPFMGRLSLQRELIAACESGRSVLAESPNSISANELNALVNDMLQKMKLPAESESKNSSSNTAGPDSGVYKVDAQPLAAAKTDEVSESVSASVPSATSNQLGDGGAAPPTKVSAEQQEPESSSVAEHTNTEVSNSLSVPSPESGVGIAPQPEKSVTPIPSSLSRPVHDFATPDECATPDVNGAAEGFSSPRAEEPAAPPTLSVVANGEDQRGGEQEAAAAVGGLEQPKADSERSHAKKKPHSGGGKKSSSSKKPSATRR